MASLETLRSFRYAPLSSPRKPFCTCTLGGKMMLCISKTKESPCIQARRARRYTEDA